MTKKITLVNSKRFGLHVKSNLSLLPDQSTKAENRGRESQSLQHASLTSKYCHPTHVLTMQKRRIVQLHISNNLKYVFSKPQERVQNGHIEPTPTEWRLMVDLVLAMEKLKSGEGLVFFALGRVS